MSDGSGIRLPSGPRLLNQATLDRFLWNQNLVVALWDAEMNEETCKGGDKLMCFEFFKVPYSDLLTCSPWWRVSNLGFIGAFRNLGLPRKGSPS